MSELPGDNQTLPTTERTEKTLLAKILDQDDDSFCLEYPIRSGETTVMRLEASTYEGAIREAKTYLGIGDDNRDEKGALWEID